MMIHVYLFGFLSGAFYSMWFMERAERKAKEREEKKYRDKVVKEWEKEQV